MCEAEFLSACKNMRREEVWAVCEMGKYEEIRQLKKEDYVK